MSNARKILVTGAGGRVSAGPAPAAAAVVKPPRLRAGDTVVMLGRYSGTHKVTGKPHNPQIVHVWRIVNGKAARFQQYADTLHVARAAGTVA